MTPTHSCLQPQRTTFSSVSAKPRTVLYFASCAQKPTGIPWVHAVQYRRATLTCRCRAIRNACAHHSIRPPQQSCALRSRVARTATDSAACDAPHLPCEKEAGAETIFLAAVSAFAFVSPRPGQYDSLQTLVQFFVVFLDQLFGHRIKMRRRHCTEGHRRGS